MLVRLSRIFAAILGSLSFVSAPQAAEYTIAVLHSLTGPAAFAGIPIKDGALMAIDEINRRQFLGRGNSLKAVVSDDAGDRTQTVTLIERYAADPNVLAVFGPTSASTAIAGLSAAAQRKIPAFTMTSSLEALRAGEWGFIITQPGAVMVPPMARYAIDKLKVKSCVTINIVDVEVFVALQKAFVENVAPRGVKIASTEGFRVQDSDFAALATKVASMDDIDCVFVAAYAPQAANVIVQLRQAGLRPEVRIIGQNGMASPDFINRGGAAVEGVFLFGDWAPGGASADGRAFATAYRTRYGNAPDNWAAMGYMSMHVLATAIKNAGPNPTRDGVRLALAKTKDVPVVVGEGKFSLGADRVPSYGTAILMVKSGQFVPAP